MAERGKEFAELVHKALFSDKRYRAQDVAERMGASYDWLFARASNRVVFCAEEIRALIACAPDPRFVHYLLRGTGFVPAERAAADYEEEDMLHRGATRIVLEAADVLEAVESALSDNRIDHAEALAIAAEIDIAERALASLRLRIREAAPSSAAAQV